MFAQVRLKSVEPEVTSYSTPNRRSATIIYLTQEEVRQYAEEIRCEFDRLFNTRLVVGRPGKQWDFFRNCFHVLMGEQTNDYACDPKKAKEYSDAISHNLTAWYSKPHIDPIRFQFLLEAKRHKSKEFAEYPCANGYMLLVIPTDPNLNASRRLR